MNEYSCVAMNHKLKAHEPVPTPPTRGPHGLSNGKMPIHKARLVSSFSDASGAMHTYVWTSACMELYHLKLPLP